MSYIDERCTCCGQWILIGQPKRYRLKMEKLPPYPQDVTLSHERCTLCGAEAVGSVRSGTEQLFVCRGCSGDFGWVLTTHLGISDPAERFRKVKAEMLRRLSMESVRKEPDSKSLEQNGESLVEIRE